MRRRSPLQMGLSLSVIGVAALFACGGNTVSVSDGVPGADAAVDAQAGDAPAGDAASGEGGSDGRAGDASASDGAQPDANSYPCSKSLGPSQGVPPEFAKCSTGADCRIVAIGCYCGNQPMQGVAAAYLLEASACEESHAMNCGLGCVVGLEVLAQDGKTTDKPSDVKVRCVSVDGGSPTCQTYVP